MQINTYLKPNIHQNGLEILGVKSTQSIENFGCPLLWSYASLNDSFALFKAQFGVMYD
jgi:hypothetical protein